MSRDLTICLTPSSRRRPPPILPIPTGPHNVRNAETEERLRQLRTGYLKINGIDYETKIDDLKYLSELGNGTSGHVVKMMHKPSNAVIAVKVRIQCENPRSMIAGSSNKIPTKISFHFHSLANATNRQ